MEDITMTNEERIARAQALFMGNIYFHNYGGFSKEEFNKKMEEEFQYLKFGPYLGSIRGSASLVSPVITLYAQIGHDLSSIAFTTNIKYYRSIILHELIHTFLKKRNKEGKVISSGLHKLLGVDVEFKEYLETSAVNHFLEMLNPISISLFKTEIMEEDFGIGANEGYTEWFRFTILKNNERITYKKLASIFFEIQEKLEKRNLNAIALIKEFKEGNYDLIFNVLNLTKEAGILFIRYMDYLYVKEYEQEQIKRYLENKELQKKLKLLAQQEKLSEKMQKILADVNDFCLKMESNLKGIAGRVLTETEKIDIFQKYYDFDRKRSLEVHNLLHSVLERSHRSTITCNFDIEDIKLVVHYFLIDYKVKTALFLDNIEYNKDLKMIESYINKLQKQHDLFSIPNMMFYKNPIFKIKVKKVKKRINFDFIDFEKLDKAFLIFLIALALFLEKSSMKNSESLINEKEIKIEDTPEKIISFDEDDVEYPPFNISEIPTDIDPEDDFESTNIMEKYFPNGISLDKGQEVYQTSYENNTVKMNYAYQNLECDTVRIIKDEEIIEKGTIADIDRFYEKANSIGAKVRLKLVINNADGTLGYVAWLDLQDAIDYFDMQSAASLKLER